MPDGGGYQNRIPYRGRREENPERRESPEESPHTGGERGHVKWYNPEKGYGFITRERGPDIFFHHSYLRPPAPADLPADTPVCFDVYEGPKGLTARNVS